MSKKVGIPIGALYVRSDDLFALLVRVVRHAENQGGDPEALRLVRNYASSLPLSWRRKLAEIVLDSDLAPEWWEWANKVKEAK